LIGKIWERGAALTVINPQSARNPVDARPASKARRLKGRPETRYACPRAGQEYTVGRAIPPRQAKRARRDPVLPPRRLLRDVLRGRRGRRAHPRYPAYLAFQGRRAAVRRTLSFRRALYRQAAQGRDESRDLRAGGRRRHR